MRSKLFFPIALLLIAAAAAAAGGYWWWQRPEGNHSDYVANGRLEAVEIQLASRLPGTVASVAVEEGDQVAPGQELLRLDSAPLNAELQQARARLQQAQQQHGLTQAQLAQAQSECEFAKKQLKRLLALREERFVSEDQLDAARTKARTTAAACRAAEAQVKAAEAGVAVADAAVQRLRVDLHDLVLTAPIGARVLYRLTEPGEVIPAGGRVLTLVSADHVYLTIFVPTAMAGRLSLGSQQQVVMDARPDVNVPTRVSFVSPQAQFTPKTVETEQERAKLMFRVKLRIEPDFLAANSDWLKPGMPGEAHIQFDH